MTDRRKLLIWVAAFVAIIVITERAFGAAFFPGISA